MTGYEHCWINQDAYVKLGYFTDEASLKYQFRGQNKCVFIFNISGEIRINEETLSARDGIGVWDTNEINIELASKTEFILIEAPINH